MSELIWTEELRLNQPQMDKTHEEFVELLAAARAALDAGYCEQGLAAFERLLDHTVDHFAQEERWMRATGFAPENCHTAQHEMVLKVMREVVRVARKDARWEPMSILAGELVAWFVQHAQTMDTALAQHLAAVGFDPATGQAAGPLPEAAITHCGGSGCG
jgi:hemerythrin-like metal-binding protein